MWNWWLGHERVPQAWSKRTFPLMLLCGWKWADDVHPPSCSAQNSPPIMRHEMMSAWKQPDIVEHISYQTWWFHSCIKNEVPRGHQNCKYHKGRRNLSELASMSERINSCKVQIRLLYEHTPWIPLSLEFSRCLWLQMEWNTWYCLWFSSPAALHRHLSTKCYKPWSLDNYMVWVSIS